MATSPQYVGVPKSSTVVISTANANRDGSGTLGTLTTAGASGSRIDCINFIARGTTTGGMLRLFIGNSLIAEIEVTPAIPSATVPVWSSVVTFEPPLILEAGVLLKVGTHNAESFCATVISGGDF